MPTSRKLQVLNHHTSKDNKLGIISPKYAVVREVKTIGDLSRNPVEIFVSEEVVSCIGKITLIDLIQPCFSSLAVFWAGVPVFSAEIVSNFPNLEKLMSHLENDKS